MEQPFSWLVQVAEVDKILALVSALVDTGHRVVFEKDETNNVNCSFTVHKGTDESIPMRRDCNVWVIDAFVDEEDGKSVDSLDQGCTRQE